MHERLTGWDVMVLREKEKQEKIAAAQERPPLREQEIVTVAHEIPLETLTRQSTVGKVAHLANERGWDVKLGESEYRTRDRWENDAVVEGRVETHRWVNAISPDGKHYLSVSKEIKILDGWPVDTVGEVLVHIDELGVHE